MTLASDNVFGDGYDLQMGTFSGDIDSGYVGSLAVAVDTTTEATLDSAPTDGGGGGGQGGEPPSGGAGGGTPPSGAPSGAAPSSGSSSSS